MAYVKHPEHGNKHVHDAEVAKLQAEGWVKWPRTKEQKAGQHVVLHVEEATFPFALEPAAVAQEPKQKRKYTRKA